MRELLKLFEYNRWANLRILGALEELSEEELHRDMGNSFASVWDTVAHLYGAEWVWLNRWIGSSPSGFPETDDLDSVSALDERWKGLWRQQLAFFGGLDEGAEEREARYEGFTGKPDGQLLGELMRHVVNHATYHRGQIVTMLRQLGKSAPSTDYVRYLREGSPAMGAQA